MPLYKHTIPATDLYAARILARTSLKRPRDFGPADQSSYFNGGDVLVMGALGSMNKWTIECVVRRDGAQTGSAIPSIVSDHFSTKVNYALLWDTGGATFGAPEGLRAGFFDGAWHVTAPYVLPDATWAHIAATYDGTAVKLYVSGALFDTLAVTATPTSDNIAVYVGAQYNGVARWKGNIRRLSIDDDAISAGTIADDYAAWLLMEGTQQGIG